MQRAHIERAQQYEHRGASVKLLPELLCLAAKAYVLEAEHRHPQGAPLPLELCEAFRGIVLATAVEKLGLDQALLLFGKEAVVRNRNQRKHLRRELERVEELYRALGLPGSPFRHLLDNDDDDDSDDK
jgi:hypothetical protein